MLTKVKPSTNINRNDLIQSYGFVEQISTNENYFKELLELVVRICDVPIAYISLLDEEQQYILSQSGIRIRTMNVKESICQHTIQSNDILEIEDTKASPLVKDLPIVNQESDGIAFYVGAPLINAQHIKIGALCVMDYTSKKLTLIQKDCLRILSKQIINTLDNQRALIKSIKKINSSFKPAACADINCLQGELDHLQEEVILQNQEIKHQQQKLADSNKKLTEFAHIVAHDVKAPLRTIGSFAELLEKYIDDSKVSHQTQCLHFIKKAVTNLDEMTTDLLAFATINSTEKEPITLSLNNLLKEVSLSLLDSINEKKAILNLPEMDFSIVGHKMQYIQLFQNLISNSIKYQAENNRPIITIQTKKEGEQVFVSVTDNGIGIPQEYLQLIFKPFKRLHNKTQYEGSGIGLATCAAIIESLQSKFVVTSQEGEGSTFSFHLPLAK